MFVRAPLQAYCRSGAKLSPAAAPSVLRWTSQYIAEHVGFNNSDDKQLFYVVCYTAAVFINTMIDLVVVLLMT